MKRKIPNIGLHLYGSPLEKVKAFLFLGVWFEERMTWAVHVGKNVERCDNVLNVMRSLAGCECGANRETLLYIYQAMIRSIIDYGSFVYRSASKNVLDRFDVLQTRDMRICCGAFRTSPVSALLIDMGEMPLWLRHIKLGLQYWIKLSGCNYTYPARCLLEVGNIVIFLLM